MARRSWSAFVFRFLCASGLLFLVYCLLEHAARLGLVALPRPVFVLVVTANRALWAPTGMAFVVPAALWLGLLWLANRTAIERPNGDRKNGQANN